MTPCRPRRRAVIAVALAAAAALCAPLFGASTAQAVVRTRLTVTWSTTTATLGQALTVRGTVAPAPLPRPVALQRRVGDRWVSVSARLTQRGGFRLRIPTLRPGERTYRVRVLRTVTARAATSRPRRVRVARPPARGNPRAFTFMATVGAAVARWNPCAPIGYRVNARLGGPGALSDTRRAMARIRRLNGLNLVYRGSTRIIPGGRNGRAYPRDTRLVVSWAKPAQSSYLGGVGVAGVGGPSWTSARNDRGRADLMVTRGFAVLNADLPLAGGFGRGPRSGYQGTRGQLLMHEIGHAIGMGHAGDDRWQILYPTMTRKPAVWGAGDLRGLVRLGAAHGCLSTRPSLRGPGGPPTHTTYLP